MKARPIPPLVPDEHVEIANHMRNIRASLMLVMRRMPVDSSIHAEAVTAILALDRVRTRLDCDLHMLVRASRDPRHMLPRVYAGSENLIWRDYTAEEIDRDDLVVWGLHR